MTGLTQETLQRMRTYRLDCGAAGEPAKLLGIQHGQARVVARNERVVVVAFAGWSENPGSRYSGLKNYYPAETSVYRILWEGQDAELAAANRSAITAGYRVMVPVEEEITYRTRTAKGGKA